MKRVFTPCMVDLSRSIDRSIRINGDTLKQYVWRKSRIVNCRHPTVNELNQAYSMINLLCYICDYNSYINGSSGSRKRSGWDFFSLRGPHHCKREFLFLSYALQYRIVSILLGIMRQLSGFSEVHCPLCKLVKQRTLPNTVRIKATLGRLRASKQKELPLNSRILTFPLIASLLNDYLYYSQQFLLVYFFMN